MNKRGLYWEVPELWRGATVAILGGGPSLSVDQVAQVCASGCRVIAVNNAYAIAPFADMLYFCDHDWWREHAERAAYREFAGIKVTLENPKVVKAEPAVRSLQNLGRTGLCAERHGLHTGQNGGYQAINLAVHLGAKRIVLLGFDMKVSADGRFNWHSGHRRKGSPDQYARLMLPKFPTLLGPLAARGVEVLNATPGSALKCFREVSLQAALAPAGALEGAAA